MTLPGIAGFVLAIGMAVDANVLVFERSKEEFGAGKRLRAALAEGFKKAWGAIGDSNATTGLAAMILFFFASGAVRGFGVMLTVGVVVSMFTALFVTRLLVDLTLRSRGLARRPDLSGMSVGARLRKRFEEKPFDIISRSKLWFVASTVIALVAVVGLLFQGLRFGLVFTGGSVNGSVVVFDRIREQRRLRKGVPPATVVNDACLQTVPRTINTGLGALAILLALYLWGGQTLTDFALALIVGIVLGTYSSVFTAAPLAFALERGDAHGDQPSSASAASGTAPTPQQGRKKSVATRTSRPTSPPPRARARDEPAKRRRRRR